MNKLTTLAMVFIATCSLFILQSCANKPKPVEPSQLEGFWVLKTMDGAEASSLFKGALPTLQFDFEKKQVFGTGGCNRYNGGFTFDNNVFKADQVAATMMMCMEENQESKFFQALGNNNVVSVENDLLTLKEEGKEGVLVFEKGTAPVVLSFEQKIAGTWMLVNIDGKPVTEVFKGKDAWIPTLTFDFEKAIVYGNSGCNDYNTKFVYDNGLLIVQAPMAMTRMTCPNQAGEYLFLQNIADTTAISFPADNKLNLTKKGNLVLEFQKEKQFEQLTSPK